MALIGSVTSANIASPTVTGNLTVTQSGTPVIAQFNRTDAGAGLVVAADSDGPYFRATTEGDVIRFNNVANNAEHARFNLSGYLGLGTTNPLAQIQTSIDGIIAGTKWLNVVIASRTSSGDTRQITVNSPGGEYYLEMFIVGLWPYSGDGYGVRKIEVAGFGSENRVTTITNTGYAGGTNPTVTISASGGNLVVQTVYNSVYRYAAITRLVWGNKSAYVSINGTDN